MNPGELTVRRVVEIDSVQRTGDTSPAIAGFAVDAPQSGELLPGVGIEINGWVIGRTGPVASVHAVVNGDPAPAALLDVRRPDVAADYRGIPHAGSSGFSFWAPVTPTSGQWSLSLQAEHRDGSRQEIASVSGRVEERYVMAPEGHRPVNAPDFVVIGAQRGGTTSLHAYLSAHPRVVTAHTKELHFLTDRHNRGADWYIGQFPATVPVGSLAGEATPYALFHPLSPARLRDCAPEARVVILLRNPIDRAYSHYLHERDQGIELLSFVDAIEAEPLRLAGEEERLLTDSAAVSYAHKHFSYLARGDYAPQLERWFAFMPRERMLILRSEDLYQRTAETFSRVLDFLGLSGVAMPFAIHNRTAGPELDPGLRRSMAQHFAPQNAALAELLGWDPEWT